MICKSIVQGACIGLVAVAIGTVHALVLPITTWNTPAPQARPAPTAPVAPVSPVSPEPPGGGRAPAPAVTAAPAGSSSHSDGRMITLARFKELMSGAVPVQVVDAREPAEFGEGHIPTAINLPPGAFSGGGIPDVVGQRLSRDLPIVVYCSGGNCDASKSVALRLMDLGFGQTFVYEDGYTGWTKAGEAVEK